MQPIDMLSLEQIDSAMSQLRSRRNALKSTGAVVQRKIATLARRRERLIAQVNVLDEQIDQLSGGQQEQPQPASNQRQTRRSQVQVSQCLDAIVECVKQHTIAKRATIIEKCHLSPVNASTYLRQLCQEGRLQRNGEKSATTYTLP